MTKTAEIFDEIESYGVDEDRYEEGFAAFVDDLEWNYKKEGVPLSAGLAKYVTSHGGEGMGDEYYVIFNLNDSLYRLDGFYSSWEGVNWDSATLVKVESYQKTITAYREVSDD